MRSTTSSNVLQQHICVQLAFDLMEKMLTELNAKGDRKPVEHVFRNLALFLSPPVTALDGGGCPLADLRTGLPDGVAERFDSLQLDGARLADAILETIPQEGRSSYDPGRTLKPTKGLSGKIQTDRIFSELFSKYSLDDFVKGTPSPCCLATCCPCL